MNEENAKNNFYLENENVNPNPDFMNLLKIASSDISMKDYNPITILQDNINFKKKTISHKDCSTDEKSYSNESWKDSVSFIGKQNLKTNFFKIESNAFTGTNNENKNNYNFEDIKFNLSQLKIENESQVNKSVTKLHQNADITFENNNYNNLENLESFDNNNINKNDADFTLDLIKKEELLFSNTNLNNKSSLETYDKIKKDDFINLDKDKNYNNDCTKFKNNYSPKKIERIYNEQYMKNLSSCKNNKGKNIEFSESERKFNLELIDNMNFSINENLLGNDSVIITNFNEIETALENKWEKILKEIEDSQVLEYSDSNIYGKSNSKDPNESLQQKINNSNVFGSYDPNDNSITSIYDIHLDKDEYENFLNMDSKQKQNWLMNKKEFYELITKKANTFNIQSFLNNKEKKRIKNPKNNLAKLRKRKSLLDIHYCHIDFDFNESYYGEKINTNSTRINGYGIYRYKNGDIYEGDFVEGKRKGLGEYIYKDKSYYRGEWDNDCKNGRGVYCKNAKEFNGLWRDNNFVSGFIFEIKNLRIDQITQEQNSFSNSKIENNINSSECVENSIEEEYLDTQQINDFFQDYATERINPNFSYGEFLVKYKAKQKEYLSNILMTNFDFLSRLKVESEIHLNDIIFNQKSIFKKFFNNNNLQPKQNIIDQNSKNDLSFSFDNKEKLEKLNIEDMIFFSDCPLEETTHDFKNIYKLDFDLKCDCQKIRNFISQFC